MHAQLLHLFVKTAQAADGNRGEALWGCETTQPFTLQWCGAPRHCGVCPCSPAEGMQIGPEQKVIPLAEGDAQLPQRALDPRPLGNAPADSWRFTGKVSQTVQECMRGGALATIGFDHEGGG